MGGNARRTTNTKRNIFYGLLQVIISQFLPFIVRTIIIYRFGVDYLGLSSLFASILSVLSLMELGFGTAIVYSMYKPVDEGDIDQISAYLSYFRKIYIFIGIAILAVGVLLLPFLTAFIKEGAVPGGLNLYLCYLIFLSDTVISYLLYGYMTAIPTAYQRRDILSKVDMCFNLLQCVVKSLLLLVSSNYYIYLLSLPALTVVRNLITARVIRRQYPELRCRGELRTDQRYDLRKKVSGLLINKLTAVSRNSIDTLCISAFIGLTVTGMYNSYYYVMSGVISFSVIVLASMMASVGNSIVAESKEKNYHDMRLFDFIYMAIAGWATVCMLCLFQPFILAWLGKDMLFGTSVVMIICAYFYILKSGDIRWVYHEGAGLWYECRFIMIGESIAHIILNIVLCKFWGVFGIVLATVLSVFMTNNLFCPQVLFKNYYMNGKLTEYWLDHACYAGTMAITAGISWCLCEKMLPMSMIGVGFMRSMLCLGGRLIICCIVAVGLFWLIWHKNGRYKEAVGWMKKIIMV